MLRLRQDALLRLTSRLRGRKSLRVELKRGSTRGRADPSDGSGRGPDRGGGSSDPPLGTCARTGGLFKSWTEGVRRAPSASGVPATVEIAKDGLSDRRISQNPRRHPNRAEFPVNAPRRIVSTCVNDRYPGDRKPLHTPQ